MKPDLLTISRRLFLGASAAASLNTNQALASDAKADHSPQYLQFAKYIAAGNDEFAGEKQAMELRASLHRAFQSTTLPVAASVSGFSPAPKSYAAIAEGVQDAIYDHADRSVAEGWRRWIQSLGTVRRIEFYILPEEIVRYEVASERERKLFYRIGRWRLSWRDGHIQKFEPLAEEVASSDETMFRDVTESAFAAVPAFEKQLSRGIPYWRSRLDPASGIDIYGSNGIAVGDIDGDGRDEIYVCQPGGLPNRLLKFGPDHRLRDITDEWRVGLLDDSSCALFLDLRNSGKQDLVVLRSAGPTLYLNRGGRYEISPDAFHFASKPQGGFTGMAAADFDRDGKLDLYLCCYVYFQSEAQYTYASPYHDAQNGPPNFLFRNRLTTEGGGGFEDCTSETGMNENNNRFSFAPAWCDFNEDGWPDLYVANDFGRKNLYVNRNGRFRDEAKQAGVEDIGPGMSASWFDYDGDGKADLYVANMWSDAGQRVIQDEHFRPAREATEKTAYMRHTRGNSLYRNRGDGTFEDATFAQHAAFGRWAWSACGVDLDNDGHPEIYSTAGMLTNESNVDLMGFFWRQVVSKSPITATASPAYQEGWNAINQFVREDYSWNGHEPNVLHAKRGNRYFDFSGISGLDFADDSRAFAVTDIDGDGRPDLILKSRLGPQVRVLQNNCCGNRNAIAFRLIGVKSNRDAVGARLTVDGQTKWLEAGSGFLSQHSKRMLFGLGTATMADSVEIFWPSGARQKLTKLAAGFTYLIREGSDSPAKEAFAKAAALRPTTCRGRNDLKLEDTWFVEPVPFPEKQRGPGLLVLDPAKLQGDRLRQYEIFRRYLFDWRTSFEKPLAFLLDDEGRAVKVYGETPTEADWKADATRMKEHARLALPFTGDYIVPPRRDYAKYGVAFLLSSYPDQALPYLEEVLRRHPENTRVLALVGQIHLQANRYRQAEAYYRKAIAGGDNSPEANYGFAMALAHLDRYDEARDYFQRAIKARPDYADAINDLGTLYIKQGQVNDAIAAFRYGIQVAPDEDMLYLNLGRTLTQLGRYDEARQLMQQLLDRKPDNQMARRALQELSGR